MDPLGPTSCIGIGDNKYCLVIVDDFSKFACVLFLNGKSDVFNTFKVFAKGAENEFEF